MGLRPSRPSLPSQGLTVTSDFVAVKLSHDFMTGLLCDPGRVT